MKLHCSQHYTLRAEQRFSQSRSTAKRMAKKALSSGLELPNTHFSKHNYPSDDDRIHRYLYQHRLYIVSGRTVLTVYSYYRPRHLLYHRGKVRVRRPYQYWRRYAVDDETAEVEDSDPG